jgi:hypothetical protein
VLGRLGRKANAASNIDNVLLVYRLAATVYCSLRKQTPWLLAMFTKETPTHDDVVFVKIASRFKKHYRL